MTPHDIRDFGSPGEFVFDGAFEKAKSAAKLNAKPAVVPVSPCTSSESSAPAAAAEAGSVACEFGDIFDKYRIDPRVLGRGRSGSVRACIDRATSRGYAVKSVRKSAPAGGLAREIELLRETNHRGIIHLVDVFEDAEHLHLVTDLCWGGELYERIADRASADNGAACFPEDEAAKTIRQILTSVSYMHRLGIVHRDIKPENILFESAREDSPVKVVNLGLARRHFRGLDSPMTSVVDTSYYVAPEVLRRSYDRSCDLWSVGVIAYILLCGYPPFNGGDDDEIHAAILRGRYYFASRDWRGVSFEARLFIHRLLQTNPGRRMTAEQALRHPWLAKYSDGSFQY